MKRYIELESVGTVIDRHTLDLIPLALDGKIMFSERSAFKTITNPEWFTEMSEKDRKLLMSIIEVHKTLYDEAIETLNLL